MTQLSFEWLLNLGSSEVGSPRSCGTVASLSPDSCRLSTGLECSMRMTTVGPERDNPGCWNGRTLTPRVTMRRQCTSVVMPLAAAVRVSASWSAALSMPMSRETALQLSYSRSMCSSKNTQTPPWSRSPSHMPSPNRKPLSYTDTLASSRCTRSPLIQILMSRLRASSSAACVVWSMEGAPMFFNPVAVREGETSCGRAENSGWLLPSDRSARWRGRPAPV